MSCRHKMSSSFVKTVKHITNLIRPDSFNYVSLNLNYSCQLNGAVNSPDVTLLNERMIGVLLLGMSTGMTCPIFIYYPDVCLERAEKDNKKLQTG